MVHQDPHLTWEIMLYLPRKVPDIVRLLVVSTGFREHVLAALRQLRVVCPNRHAKATVLAVVPRMVGLVALSVRRVGLCDTDLPKLRACPALQEFCCEREGFGDDGLRALVGTADSDSVMPLRRFELRGHHAHEEGGLGEFMRLRRGGSRLTGEGIAYVLRRTAARLEALWVTLDDWSRWRWGDLSTAVLRCPALRRIGINWPRPGGAEINTTPLPAAEGASNLELEGMRTMDAIGRHGGIQELGICYRCGSRDAPFDSGMSRLWASRGLTRLELGGGSWDPNDVVLAVAGACQALAH